MIKTLAQTIAFHFHKGQYYGDSDLPYSEHLMDVVDNAISMYLPNDTDLNGDDSELLAACWLHDVVEDCGVSLQLLSEMGMTQEVIAAVDAVTKREGESLDDYLGRIIEAGDLAVKVKLSDSLANLRASMANSPSIKRNLRIAKYTYVISKLSEAQLELSNGNIST